MEQKNLQTAEYCQETAGRRKYIHARFSCEKEGDKTT